MSNLSIALTNLRWCMWGLASAQTKLPSQRICANCERWDRGLFEVRDFTPLIWSERHGCSIGVWNECVKAAAHSLRGVGGKHRYADLSLHARRREERKTYTAKFWQIVEQLEEDWLRELGYWRPEFPLFDRAAMRTEVERALLSKPLAGY